MTNVTYTTHCNENNYLSVCSPYQKCYEENAKPWRLHEYDTGVCECDSFYGFGGEDCTEYTGSTIINVFFLGVLPVVVWFYALFGSLRLVYRVKKAEGFEFNAVGRATIGVVLSSFFGMGLPVCSIIGVISNPGIDASQISSFKLYPVFLFMGLIFGVGTLLSVPLAWIHIVKLGMKKTGGDSTKIDRARYYTYASSTVVGLVISVFLFLRKLDWVAAFIIIVTALINVAYFFGSRMLVPIMVKNESNPNKHRTITRATVGDGRRSSLAEEQGGKIKLTQSVMIVWICNRLNLTSFVNIVSCLFFIELRRYSENGKLFHWASISNGIYIASHGMFFCYMLIYLRFSYHKILNEEPGLYTGGKLVDKVKAAARKSLDLLRSSELQEGGDAEGIQRDRRESHIL